MTTIPISFLFIICVIVFVYTITIISYTKGWNKLDEIKTNKETPAQHSFSIIIAFRNEAQNLISILNDLQAVDYSKSLFEIILVDDESTDNSKQIVIDYIHDNKLNWKLLSSKGGKKAAIKTALQTARNEYIFSTDADCKIPKDILCSYNQHLQLKKSKLIAGPVDFYSNNSILGKLMELEFMSLIVSGAGAIGIGKPTMLNAANMVFERKIAIESIDYIYNTTVQSGDDIFLLHYIISKYGENEISFIKNKKSIIKTPAPDSLISWTKQRIRWASKAKHYKINHTSKSAIIVLLYNIILFSSFFLLNNPNYWFIYPILLITKSAIDFSILKSAASFFNKKLPFLLYFFLEILYPFYIVVIGIVSQFIKVEWKGRKG